MSDRDEVAVQSLIGARYDGAARVHPDDRSSGCGLDPTAAAVPGQITDPDNERERRLADQELVDGLASCGFSGPRYERFRDELARYGMSVLSGWMCSGYVFRLAARHGIALRPTDHELDELHRDQDLRQELAMMIVAVALGNFRQHALIEGGWRIDGGASLTTYFMGACLSAFPNEFRKHRSQTHRWRTQDAADPAVTSSEVADVNPADLVPGNMRVRDDLARADPRTRAIVALRMDGYHLEEIAEMLSEKSARAVEGVLYRWRTSEVRRMREGGE